MKEAGIDLDIPEPFDTLEENAAEKARTIYELTQTACFGEDSGLEVRALQGAPGVKSARYAGEDRSFSRNNEKLLKELEGAEDRGARFRTVICLMLNGGSHFFEGICEGTIISSLRGADGFGYDPVFIPKGSDRTFAEMSLAEKNAVSHRNQALGKLVAFLKHLPVNSQY